MRIYIHTCDSAQVLARVCSHVLAIGGAWSPQVRVLHPRHAQVMMWVSVVSLADDVAQADQWDPVCAGERRGAVLHHAEEPIRPRMCACVNMHV